MVHINSIILPNTPINGQLKSTPQLYLNFICVFHDPAKLHKRIAYLRWKSYAKKILAILLHTVGFLQTSIDPFVIA